MRTRLPRFAAAALAAGLTLGLASPALAQEAPEAPPDAERHVDLDHLKRGCDQAIERRLDDLATAHRRLDDVEVLTDDHEAALDRIIDGTVTRLARLRHEIAEADDVATALRLCHTIAPDYRVYLVVLPQVHLTVATDRVDAAVGVADELAAEFQEALDRATAAGADVTEAVALFEQAQAHVAAADTANDGVAASVLAVTPASWNEGPGRDALDGARSSLRSARAELQGAEEDGRAAVQALRDAVADLPGAP